MKWNLIFMHIVLMLTRSRCFGFYSIPFREYGYFSIPKYKVRTYFKNDRTPENSSFICFKPQVKFVVVPIILQIGSRQWTRATHVILPKKQNTAITSILTSLLIVCQKKNKSPNNRLCAHFRYIVYIECENMYIYIYPRAATPAQARNNRTPRRRGVCKSLVGFCGTCRLPNIIYVDRFHRYFDCICARHVW